MKKFIIHPLLRLISPNSLKLQSSQASPTYFDVEADLPPKVFDKLNTK